MMSKNLQRYYTLKCLKRDLLSNVFVSQKFWLAKVFDLSCRRGNETSTNIVYSTKQSWIINCSCFCYTQWYLFQMFSSLVNTVQRVEITIQHVQAAVDASFVSFITVISMHASRIIG